jgi:hypothetical protein
MKKENIRDLDWKFLLIEIRDAWLLACFFCVMRERDQYYGVINNWVKEKEQAGK